MQSIKRRDDNGFSFIRVAFAVAILLGACVLTVQTNGVYLATVDRGFVVQSDISKVWTDESGDNCPFEADTYDSRCHIKKLNNRPTCTLQAVNCQGDIQYVPTNPNNVNTATDVCHICGAKFAGLARRVIPTGNSIVPEMTICQACFQLRGTELGLLGARIEICRSMSGSSALIICTALLGMADVQPEGIQFDLTGRSPYIQSYSQLVGPSQVSLPSFSICDIGLISSSVFVDMAHNSAVFCNKLKTKIQSESWESSKAWFTTNWNKMYTKFNMNQLPSNGLFSVRITEVYNTMIKYFYSNISPEPSTLMMERTLVMIGGEGRGTGLHVDW